MNLASRIDSQAPQHVGVALVESFVRIFARQEVDQQLVQIITTEQSLTSQQRLPPCHSAFIRVSTSPFPAQAISSG